jgi:regulator of nucleoside diphosphate kinase
MHDVLKARNSKKGSHLKTLLNNYEQVNINEFGTKGVRLNSVVELWHYILQKNVKFQIVLPSQADRKNRKLSVFSPLCLAIFGRMEGELPETNRAGIRKKYKIVKVQN